jgi:hypothetical protein
LIGFGEDQIGRGIRRVEQAVQRRIEQIVADDHQPGMLLRLGPVIGHHVAHRQGRRELQFTDDSQRWVLPSRKCLRASPNDFGSDFKAASISSLSLQIGESERVRAGDQPVQHAVAADIVSRAFDIDAAAAERFRHEPCARNLVAPERLIEQDRDAQIMRRPVEIGDVLDHRALRSSSPFPVRWWRATNAAGTSPPDRSRLVIRPLAVHHVELIAAGIAVLPTLSTRWLNWMSASISLAQLLDQLLVAVLDRIEADIAVYIHHEILQRIEAVGVVVSVAMSERAITFKNRLATGSASLRGPAIPRR